MLRTTRSRQGLQWKPLAFGVGLLGGGAAAFIMSHREEVPITGRKRFVGVNRAQEQRLGKAAFEQLKVEQKRNVVMDNKKEIERILARLSKESGIPEFQDMKWNVMVLRNPTPNAFVLPGGYCVVHTGIFQVAKNVDGLATVLSHEAAHVLARHGAERMSSGFILMPLVLLVSSVFSLPVTWVQAVAQLLLMLPNSRLQESEADEIGAVLMARACIYDPHEAVSFWRRFGKIMEQQAEPIEFMSTHPSNKTRELALVAIMDKVDAERRKRCASLH